MLEPDVLLAYGVEMEAGRCTGVVLTIWLAMGCGVVLPDVALLMYPDAAGWGVLLPDAAS